MVQNPLVNIDEITEQERTQESEQSEGEHPSSGTINSAASSSDTDVIENQAINTLVEIITQNREGNSDESNQTSSDPNVQGEQPLAETIEVTNSHQLSERSGTEGASTPSPISPPTDTSLCGCCHNLHPDHNARPNTPHEPASTRETTEHSRDRNCHCHSHRDSGQHHQVGCCCMSNTVSMRCRFSAPETVHHASERCRCSRYRCQGLSNSHQCQGHDQFGCIHVPHRPSLRSETRLQDPMAQNRHSSRCISDDLPPSYDSLYPMGSTPSVFAINVERRGTHRSRRTGRAVSMAHRRDDVLYNGWVVRRNSERVTQLRF